MFLNEHGGCGGGVGAGGVAALCPLALWHLAALPKATTSELHFGGLKSAMVGVFRPLNLQVLKIVALVVIGESSWLLTIN